MTIKNTHCSSQKYSIDGNRDNPYKQEVNSHEIQRNYDHKTDFHPILQGVV